jgi:catechol 2,3-dioxygenase-like lactoylglutathione lyase family enzyme
MLHHVSLGTRNIEVAVRFYDAVLATLGYVRVWSDLRPGEEGQAVGYGAEGSNDQFAMIPNIPGFHLAFHATKRSAVIAFYEAALSAGGRDNGAPGLRPDYGANYFAAFITDPEGHRLEAVCMSSNGEVSDSAA